ncbi:AraC family transcriptional regulator [Rhodococcus sp. NPDC058521]|uniref:AraC family transcriptional regulator n=1 Tax=Rhodococcus sp. NPDC058521 TaxID=3346536 RepID=UPI00364BCAF5
MPHWKDAPTVDPRTVSNAYVRTLISTVEKAGMPRSLLLKGLHPGAADLVVPNGRISVEVVHRLWERAVDYTRNRLLGLAMAANVTPGTFRSLGLAMVHAASLAEVLILVARHSRLVSEVGSLTVGRHDDGAMSVIFSDQMLRKQLLPQQAEVAIGAVHTHARWLSGHSQVIPQAVSFRHPPQGGRSAYEDFFGVPVRFGAPLDEYVLSATDLAAPLPYADAELFAIQAARLEQELACLPPVGFVSAFAIQWLEARPPGSVRISDLAVRMGTSVRSLQRQLAAEDTSWSQVVDSARRNACTSLLTQGLPLDQIAQRLGYHDASSLSRAAKRWFGTTPGRMRGL